MNSVESKRSILLWLIENRQIGQYLCGFYTFYLEGTGRTSVQRSGTERSEHAGWHVHKLACWRFDGHSVPTTLTNPLTLTVSTEWTPSSPHRRVAYSRRVTEKRGRERKMQRERICTCCKCEEDSGVGAFCFGWVCVVLHWQAFDGSCEENKLSGFAHGLSTLKCCDVAGWWSFDRLQTDPP